MSDVQVTQAHHLGAEEAKNRLQSFEGMVAKYGVKADWSGNKANLKGTGVSGDIAVSDTSVTVTIKLGMLARMAGVDAARLQESIEKRLSSAFEAEA